MSVKGEFVFFDFPDCLKCWSMNMYNMTATKEQLKLFPHDVDLNFIWDDIQVVSEKPVYFDYNHLKLPKSQCLFSSTFRNNTDAEQEYTFRTERSTRSVVEIEISKGIVMSKEMSIKLALPCEIMEANAGFKSEISLSSTSRQSKEEELNWAVDTRITVPAKKEASAEVKINEEQLTSSFRLLTKIHGPIRVIFTDRTHDNKFVKYIDGDIGQIVEDNISSRRKRKQEFIHQNHDSNCNSLDAEKDPIWTEPIPGSGRRQIFIQTSGKCQFRFGINQVVEVVQKTI